MFRLVILFSTFGWQSVAASAIDNVFQGDSPSSPIHKTPTSYSSSSSSSAGYCALKAAGGNLQEYVVTTTRSVVLPPELVHVGDKGGGNGSNTLARYTLKDNVLTKCNDGTSAVYYVGTKETTSGEWVIQLGGLGACDTETRCDARANESPWATGSFLWPKKIYGTTLLSTDPNKNIRFHNSHHVFVPSCSSDFWLGNRSASADTARGFHFRGRAIFQAMVQALVKNHNLDSSAHTVILAGSSAGAIGALNNAKWLQQELKLYNIRVMVIMDGGWALPLAKASLVGDPAKVQEMWGLVGDQSQNGELAYAAPVPVEALWSQGDGSHLADSAAGSVGPCDLYPTCFIEQRTKKRQGSQNITANSSEFSHPPILVLQSRFDSEQLHSIVDSDLSSEEHNTTSALPMLIRIERRVQSFGALMESSLRDGLARDMRIAVWSASCFQHEYLRDRHLVTRLVEKYPIAAKTQSEIMNKKNLTFYTGWDGSRSLQIGLFSYLKQYGFGFPEDIDPVKQEKQFERNITMWPGDGLDTEIHQANYMGALTVWMRSFEGLSVEDVANDNRQNLAWFDNCEGVGCNPTCSERLTKRAPYDRDIIASGWSWLSRIIAVLVLTTSVCVQIYFCRRDSNMFNYLAILRKIDIDYGSPAYHQESKIQVARDAKSINGKHVDHESKEINKTLSKSSEVDAFDSSRGAVDIHSATFYAPSRSSDSSRASQLWAKKMDAETNHQKSDSVEITMGETHKRSSLQASTAKDTVDENPRLASLSTLNLVYDVEFKDSTTTKLVRKRVVNGVSVVMNPGELVAIMGPSGSGKTTLLDCIARPAQKMARMQGDVFINGVSTRTQRGLELHSCSIGYVRQLTTPWDPKLTVLENMVYTARLRLPKHMPLSEKLAVVSKCIADTGMTSIMDSIVGGHSGGGISGGQKRLLSVALQMIMSPAVLIMDEPTLNTIRNTIFSPMFFNSLATKSGLDAKKAMQLVSISRKMANEGRIVALTIHQPRPEIFCMFDRVILLCAGSVVFQGSPVSVGSYLAQHPSLLGHNHTEDELECAIDNPADAVIDGLGSKIMQQLAIKWYARTPQAVSIVKAIENANERAADHWRSERGAVELERVESAIEVRGVDFAVALQTYTGRHVWRNLFQLSSSAAIVVTVTAVLTALLFRGVTSANQVVSEIMIIYALSAGLPPGAVVGQYMMPLIVEEANDSALRSSALLTHNVLTGLSFLGLQTIFASCIAYFIAINEAHWDALELWDFWVLLYENTVTLEMAFWAFFYATGSRMPFNMYLIFVNILNGFIVARKDYLPGLHWLPMTGSMHWGISGSMQVMLKNKTYCEFKEADPDPIIHGFTCFATSGDIVLEWFSVSHISLYASSVVILGIFCLFSCLSIFGLGYYIGIRSDAQPQPGSLVHRVMKIHACFQQCLSGICRRKELVPIEDSAGRKSRKELEMRVMTSQMILPEEIKVLRAMVVLPHEYWEKRQKKDVIDVDNSEDDLGDLDEEELETLVEHDVNGVSEVDKKPSLAIKETDDGKERKEQHLADQTQSDHQHNPQRTFENKVSLHGWGTLRKELRGNKWRHASQYTHFKKVQHAQLQVLRAFHKSARQVDKHASFQTDEFALRRASMSSQSKS